MDNKKMPARAATQNADTRNHIKSNIISKECQIESYQFVKADKQKRISMILRALGEAEMTAREIASVSYTHLDVYKRQR